MCALITLITNNYRSIDSLCYRAVSIIWSDRGEYYSLYPHPLTYQRILFCIYRLLLRLVPISGAEVIYFGTRPSVPTEPNQFHSDRYLEKLHRPSLMYGH
jgi:hypothetical protein